MNKITFYDTETTDLPDWKTSSSRENQPHLVSLCAIQCDEETGKIIQRVDLIVKSDGWESKPEAFATHGITKEFSIEVGVSEQSAVKMLFDCCYGSIRVAHNRTFDQRIIRIALKRYSVENNHFFTQGMIDEWAEKENHLCTMLSGKDAMKVKKWPSLTEAYKHFLDKDLKKAHSSTVDTEACMEIYFAMKKANHEFR